MSRFLMVTWDGAGNLVSTLGIAKHLAAIGHDVRVLGHRSIQDRVGDHGWRFRPYVQTEGYDGTKPFDLDTEMADLGQKLMFNGSVASDVLDELEREPADVIIGDCMLMGALCAGEAAGIPTVALFHTGYALYRGGPLVEMMAPALPAANAIRTDLGLAPVERFSDIHDACSLNIVALPKEFEPPMGLNPKVVHVGPILDGPPLLKASDEVEDDDGSEPLIVVSLSTSHQGQVPTLQLLVDALSRLPVRVIVTTGPAVDPAVIDAPDNAQVVRFVPHDRLLPKASLVVTHAGLGTVMTALAHGVPMLCVPMGRDQHFNAARVEELGAGRTIGADADGAAIANAVAALLEDGEARDGAKRMANVIAGYGGAADAVAELERLVAKRR